MLILFGVILILLLLANVFLLGINFADIRCAEIQVKRFDASQRCTPKNLTPEREGLIFTSAMSSLQYQDASSYECPSPADVTLDKYGLYQEDLQTLLSTVPSSENRMLRVGCGKFCTDSKFYCDDACNTDLEQLRSKSRSLSFEKPSSGFNLIAALTDFFSEPDEELSINCLQLAKNEQVGLWGLNGHESCVFCTLLDVKLNENFEFNPVAVNKFCDNQGAPMTQMTAPFNRRSTQQQVSPDQLKSSSYEFYEADYYGMCSRELLSIHRSPVKNSFFRTETLPKFFSAELVSSDDSACSAGEYCNFYTPCPFFADQNSFSCQSAWINSFSDLSHSRSFADMWFRDYVQTLTKLPNGMGQVSELFKFQTLFSVCLKLMKTNLESHGWSAARQDHPCFKQEGMLAVAAVCSTYTGQFIDSFNQVAFDGKPQPLHCGHTANPSQDQTAVSSCSVYRNSISCNKASENGNVCRFVRGRCLQTEIPCPTSATDRQFTDPLPAFSFWSLAQNHN